jgi:hypothetical protein
MKSIISQVGGILARLGDGNSVTLNIGREKGGRSTIPKD